MKYVNKFGYNEYGKSRWNKLSEKDKAFQNLKIIRECDVEETFKIMDSRNSGVVLIGI